MVMYMTEAKKSTKLNDITITCDILHLLYRTHGSSWEQIYARFSDINHEDVSRIVMQLDSYHIIGMGFDQGTHGHEWSLKI